MIPAAFTSYFLVGPAAPVERRTRTVSAYTALLNAFFVSITSITALIPHINIGHPTQDGQPR